MTTSFLAAFVIEYWVTITTLSVFTAILATGIFGDHGRLSKLDAKVKTAKEFHDNIDPGERWFKKVFLFWIGVSDLASTLVGLVLQLCLGSLSICSFYIKANLCFNLPTGIIAILESKGKLRGNACRTSLILNLVMASYISTSSVPRDTRPGHYWICLYHAYILSALLNAYATVYPKKIAAAYISLCTAVLDIILLCVGGLDARYFVVSIKNVSAHTIDVILISITFTIVYYVILTTASLDAGGDDKKNDSYQPLIKLTEKDEQDFKKHALIEIV